MTVEIETIHKLRTSEKKGSLEYAPFFIAMAGVVISIITCLVFKDLEDQKLRQTMLADVKVQFRSIEQAVETNLGVLDSVKSFYDATPHISRSEFQTFVNPLLRKYANAQALEWIPKILNSERQKYETQAQVDGLEGFTIKEKNQGAMVTANIRDEYFPVYFVEPLQTNKAAVGFDLASNPKRLEALNTSRDSGEKVATARITLVQENEKQAGLLIFNPVYDNATFYKSIEERQKYIEGFVLMVLRVGDMISQALGENESNFDIQVEDIISPGNTENIINSVQGQAVPIDAFSYTDVLDLAGRQWKITLTPRMDAYKNLISRLPWIILGSGLVFTALLTLLFMQLIRRRQIVEDLVEQRTSELKHTMEDLQLTNDELEKFAYVASHDLKSPLRAIDNLSLWLDEDLGDALTGKNKEYMEKLRGRVFRMDRLLDDLLDYSRTGQTEQKSNPIETDLLIKEITELLNIQEGFLINIDDSLKQCTVSKSPLDLIFRNLIDNAIKHHDKTEGTITVSMKPNGQYYEFTVDDDGPGIDPKFHEKVFEMFQTLKPRDEVEGSGMGMAMVKKILFKHGGRIILDSDIGQGTRFIFTWPK